MRRQKIKWLRLSGYAGWRENDLSFLPQLEFLERLDLWTTTVRDLTPIYQLGELQALSLNGVISKVEFDRIPKLNDLHLAQWRKAAHASVFSCRHLKNLGVCGYSGATLEPWGSIKSLENIALSFSRVQSLAGIGLLPMLRRLSLARVNRLTRLDGIEESRALLLLWVEGAAKLEDISALGSVKTLRTLNLTDCPHLETLKGIRGLPDLEAVWFFGKTNIEDGDLSALKTLPKLKYAKFVDRRHYSHKSDEFPKNTDIFL